MDETVREGTIAMVVCGTTWKLLTCRERILQEAFAMSMGGENSFAFAHRNREIPLETFELNPSIPAALWRAGNNP
ncbi:MAG: hypothetical protein HY961_13545 [Ignavibacteriae bacterium]|nr:hypothetical protein [Ignavibacteriota bacterium]